MDKIQELEERLKIIEELLMTRGVDNVGCVEQNNQVLEQIKNDKGITDEEKAKDHREKVLNALDGEQGTKFYSYFDNEKVSSYTSWKYNEEQIKNIDSINAEKLFVAFASNERVDILKLLMRRGSCLGSEIMGRCGFNTTGKLYYHLNFLLNIGLITNDNGQYRLVAKMCGIMQSMFMAAADFERTFKKYE